MGFFGIGETSRHQDDGRENRREQETIHKDFAFIESEHVWHGNTDYITGRANDTLPGYSWDFRLNDETLGDFFEDFPYPARIHRDGEIYVCEVFVSEKTSPNVGELVAKYHADIISEPEFPKPEEEHKTTPGVAA